MANRQYRTNSDRNQPVSYDSALPTEQPIAIYYRQSTDAQIGNISTTLQTVDMVKYLKQQGWADDQIIMIDMDGGVSGATKIDERKGMRLLFSLITQDKIGAVACEDEDRLFRDVTQIQVNVFIEACRAHNVRVITPSIMYHFAHETLGVFHARQFRFKAEFAADYLNVVVKGKLLRARMSLLMNGQWAGAPIPVGFMIDMRKKLPDGSVNPNWRHFEIFEPFASVIREYYQVYLKYSGNSFQALRHIHQYGPYFPDPSTCLPPEGFRTVYKIKQVAGRWHIKSKTSFVRLLTNAAYIGHWMVGNTIVHWNHHDAIVDEETFYKVFNYLSEVALDGSVNTNYHAIRYNTRPSKDAKRKPDRPLFAGLLFSPWEGQLRQVGTVYRKKYNTYHYTLIATDGFDTKIWVKKADFIDASVSAFLAEKLQMTFDYDKWNASVESSTVAFTEQRKLMESQIHQVQIVMDNLITSLATLSTPQLIAAVEARYQEAQTEYQRLQHELNAVNSNIADVERIRSLKHSFSNVFDDWENMSGDAKREVVQVFVKKIIARVDKKKDDFQLTIEWKDGSSDNLHLLRAASTGSAWLPHQVAHLMELFESGASPVEIAKAFPDRPWVRLHRKYKDMTGKSVPRKRPYTIHKYETYNQYAARMGLNGSSCSTSELSS